jgi:hypothetical protein
MSGQGVAETLYATALRAYDQIVSLELGDVALRIAAPDPHLQARPGGGDGVAGSRPSVRACGSGARGDEHRDRGSNFTVPPHYDPAAPSHVPRHSLKASRLSCLAAARDGGGGMSREATCPCSRRLADAAGLVVGSNAAVMPASRGIDFGVTYVAY